MTRPPSDMLIDIHLLLDAPIDARQHLRVGSSLVAVQYHGRCEPARGATPICRPDSVPPDKGSCADECRARPNHEAGSNGCAQGVELDPVCNLTLQVGMLGVDPCVKQTDQHTFAPGIRRSPGGKCIDDQEAPGRREDPSVRSCLFLRSVWPPRVGHLQRTVEVDGSNFLNLFRQPGQFTVRAARAWPAKSRKSWERPGGNRLLRWVRPSWRWPTWTNPLLIRGSSGVRSELLDLGQGQGLLSGLAQK